MFFCPLALQRREGKCALEISGMDPVDTLIAQGARAVKKDNYFRHYCRISFSVAKMLPFSARNLAIYRPFGNFKKCCVPKS